MYQLINESQFIQAFKGWDTYKDNFSYEGLKELYQFFEELEEDENGIELDVVAICCEFSEYEDIEDYNEQNKTEFEHWEDLQHETLVLGAENGNLIVQDY